MLIPYATAAVRRASGVEIRNYVTNEISSTFSVAVVTLRGPHPKSLNKQSDRAYVILEGDATVEVGDHTYSVAGGDTVYIPKNTPHSINGDVRYVVINAPPFSPANEVPLETSK